MSDSFQIWAIASTVAAAIAAIFSAIAAFLSLRLQRQMSLDAVRPELVPNEFLSPDELGNFEIRSIQNVGDGPALHTSWDLKVKGRPKAFAAVMCDSVSIVPAGEQQPINAHGFFQWEDGTRLSDNEESIDLVLSVLCTDSYGYHHETRMNLVATRGEFRLGQLVSAERLAPGLDLVSRDTFVRSPWRRKWTERIRSLLSRIQRKSRPPARRRHPMARSR